MKKYITSFVPVIFSMLLIGCDKETNIQSREETNPITLNCKFQKESGVRSLFINIDKNNIELKQNFLYEGNERVFYNSTKEITPSIITIKSYRKNDWDEDSYLEHTIEINRFTGEIKETVVGYFPKEKEERNRKNRPIQFFGVCETLKDKQF